MRTERRLVTNFEKKSVASIISVEHPSAWVYLLVLVNQESMASINRRVHRRAPVVTEEERCFWLPAI